MRQKKKNICKWDSFKEYAKGAQVSALGRNSNGNFLGAQGERIKGCS